MRLLCSNGFLGIAKLLITLGEDADQVHCFFVSHSSS